MTGSENTTLYNPLSGETFLENATLEHAGLNFDDEYIALEFRGPFENSSNSKEDDSSGGEQILDELVRN